MIALDSLRHNTTIIYKIYKWSMNEKYFYNHACHRKKSFDDVGQLNYVERSVDEGTFF